MLIWTLNEDIKYVISIRNVRVGIPLDLGKKRVGKPTNLHISLRKLIKHLVERKVRRRFNKKCLSKRQTASD